MGNVTEDVYILSFDIISYYPTVNPEMCHEAAMSLMKNINYRKVPTVETIIQTSRMCIQNITITYKGKYHKQSKGVPAGLSHIPALTDIGSNPLMHKMVNEAPFETLKDRSGKCCIGLYRDDGIGLIRNPGHLDSSKIKSEDKQLNAIEVHLDGYKGCGKCMLCKFSHFDTKVKNFSTGFSYPLKENFNCDTKNAVYYVWVDVNEKIPPYVGMSTNPKSRFSAHKYHSNNHRTGENFN